MSKKKHRKITTHSQFLKNLEKRSTFIFMINPQIFQLINFCQFHQIFCKASLVMRKLHPKSSNYRTSKIMQKIYLKKNWYLRYIYSSRSHNGSNTEHSRHSNVLLYLIHSWSLQKIHSPPQPHIHQYLKEHINFIAGTAP